MRCTCGGGAHSGRTRRKVGGRKSNQSKSNRRAEGEGEGQQRPSTHMTAAPRSVLRACRSMREGHRAAHSSRALRHSAPLRACRHTCALLHVCRCAGPLSDNAYHSDCTRTPQLLELTLCTSGPATGRHSNCTITHEHPAITHELPALAITHELPAL